MSPTSIEPPGMLTFSLRIGVDHVLQRDAVVVHAREVDVDLDLALQTAADVGTQHGRDRLEAILQLLGDLLEAHQPVLAGQVHLA